MISKSFSEINGALRAEVTFSLPGLIEADRICLVGDFNNWDRESHLMHRDNLGGWTITLKLEVNRIYQFRYLADGHYWLNDDGADAYVHNRFGSSNFVVVTDPGFKPYADSH